MEMLLLFAAVMVLVLLNVPIAVALAAVALVAHGQRAHAIGVRRIESLREFDRHLSYAWRETALRAQEIGERAIAPAPNAREDPAHRSPEIVDALPLSAAHPPVIIGEFVDEKSGGVDDAEGLLYFAVDELRAELDREGEIGLVESEDAAADALARFDDDNTPAGAR